MDVADEASVVAAAASLRSDGVSLTHIVHNAGIYGPKGTLDGRERQGRAAAPPVTKAHMLQTFEINAIGPLLVAQNFAPLLAPSGPQTMPVLASSRARWADRRQRQRRGVRVPNFEGGGQPDR